MPCSMSCWRVLAARSGQPMSRYDPQRRRRLTTRANTTAVEALLDGEPTRPPRRADSTPDAGAGTPRAPTTGAAALPVPAPRRTQPEVGASPRCSVWAAAVRDRRAGTTCAVRARWVAWPAMGQSRVQQLGERITDSGFVRNVIGPKVLEPVTVWYEENLREGDGAKPTMAARHDDGRSTSIDHAAETRTTGGAAPSSGLESARAAERFLEGAAQDPPVARTRRARRTHRPRLRRPRRSHRSPTRRSRRPSRRRPRPRPARRSVAGEAHARSACGSRTG